MDDYKKVTIDSYNRNFLALSKKFKRLTDIHRRKEFPTFIKLLRGDKILDLGCGSGDHAEYFSRQGLDVTCVDLSEEMIKLCKDKGLKTELMDIENLKFEDNSFDGILAIASLLHVPKIKIGRVVDDIYRILKDGGILYVGVKEGYGERFVEKNGRRFFSFYQENELLEYFNKFELLDSWKSVLGESIFLELFFRKLS